jgi:hypothetical protein
MTRGSRPVPLASSPHCPSSRCAVAFGLASLVLAYSVGAQGALSDTAEQVRRALSAVPSRMEAA